MKIPTQIWIFCVGIFLQHYTFLQKRTFCILCEKFFHFVRKATSSSDFVIFQFAFGIKILFSFTTYVNFVFSFVVITLPVHLTISSQMSLKVIFIIRQLLQVF